MAGENKNEIKSPALRGFFDYSIFVIFKIFVGR